MTMKKQPLLPGRVIINKIILLRDHKVIVDRDLAILYGVETRVLNQAGKRNIKRFPSDFMYQLTPEEMKTWKSQIVISGNDKMGLR
jgi:hypothetical protein